MLLREIASNCIANAVFWLLLGIIAWLVYRVTRGHRFETFFGLAQDRTLVIYLSNLWDPRMSVRPWGEVIAGNELHAASELQGTITRIAPRFPGLVRGLVEEWFTKDSIHVAIEVSPREECVPQRNLIVIGSAFKNSVRRCLLRDGKLLVRIAGEVVTPPTGIHANPLEDAFIVARSGHDERHEVSVGLAPAVIERVVVCDEPGAGGPRVAFTCVGKTGFESRIASEYLAHHWPELEQAFRKQACFARCLSLDSNGTVHHYFDVVQA